MNSGNRDQVARMTSWEFEKRLSAEQTDIPGLMILELPVHGDERGWFKENWQREKMVSLGVPDFRPVQNNVSFNFRRGVTRGIHAEPWDKFISLARGSAFCAWVDLREDSPCFGQVYTCVLDPSRAAFVPRGVGNSFQALEDETIYSYLVTDHWSADSRDLYTYVNLADPTLKIPWPIPLDRCSLSEADRHHPPLCEVSPMASRRVLVTGCSGQVGRALRREIELRGEAGRCDFVDIDTFDIADPSAYDRIVWSRYGAVINCAAWTAVDRAETEEGRASCWRANATGPALLARACSESGAILVHISSDYVFDGVRDLHDEREPPAPLGAYGQSKAAGDAAVSVCPHHYIVRTGWVVGEGHNFVRTMESLSDRCADEDDGLDEVQVVDDQLGRLTFASDLARAIMHLLDTSAPYGIYNMTNTGRVASWADIAQRVFALKHKNEERVVPVNTERYRSDIAGPHSPRPMHSTLNLSKIESTGFCAPDWELRLEEYVCRR